MWLAADEKSAKAVTSRLCRCDLFAASTVNDEGAVIVAISAVLKKSRLFMVNGLSTENPRYIAKIKDQRGHYRRDKQGQPDSIGCLPAKAWF